mgnify:CR=1 FL=1
MRVIRYRLNQVKLGIDESVNVLPRRIAARYGKGHKDTIKIFDVEIIRDSIDARRKSDIKKVYTVDFSSDVKLDLPEAPDMAAPLIAPKAKTSAKTAATGATIFKDVITALL